MRQEKLVHVTIDGRKWQTKDKVTLLSESAGSDLTEEES
jgi:hypothetical protein